MYPKIFYTDSGLPVTVGHLTLACLDALHLPSESQNFSTESGLILLASNRMVMLTGILTIS